uniref:Uncharacterized protein n=1 Tax=Timema tahoe TaxID=61484 RepID=A0A7R9IHD9_9NEOP|nr:unnamed protein product [Timema tahoe]
MAEGDDVSLTGAEKESASSEGSAETTRGGNQTRLRDRKPGADEKTSGDSSGSVYVGAAIFRNGGGETDQHREWESGEHFLYRGETDQHREWESGEHFLYRGETNTGSGSQVSTSCIEKRPTQGVGVSVETNTGSGSHGEHFLYRGETNTGSGSQEEEEEMDKDGFDDCHVIPNDKSTEFILATVAEETAMAVSLVSPAPLVDPNGNNDSGYAASNLEETALQSSIPNSPHRRKAPSQHDDKHLHKSLARRNGAAAVVEPVQPPAAPAPQVKRTESTEGETALSGGSKKERKATAGSSRFTIYKVNKASRKKREKSSAKKERKATKTLAIVLGELETLLGGGVLLGEWVIVPEEEVFLGEWVIGPEAEVFLGEWLVPGAEVFLGEWVIVLEEEVFLGEWVIGPEAEVFLGEWAIVPEAEVFLGEWVIVPEEEVFLGEWVIGPEAEVFLGEWLVPGAEVFLGNSITPMVPEGCRTATFLHLDSEGPPTTIHLSRFQGGGSYGAGNPSEFIFTPTNFCSYDWKIVLWITRASPVFLQTLSRI